MEKYTEKQLREAVKNSASICGVLRHLGSKVTTGSTHKHYKDRIEKLNIDTSHFVGRYVGLSKRGQKQKLLAEEVLVMDRRNGRREDIHILRRALDEKKIKRTCIMCGLGQQWNNKPLTLQVDHINGNPVDNRLENLRYLCPNCHTQTETHGKLKQ